MSSSHRRMLRDRKWDIPQRRIDLPPDVSAVVDVETPLEDIPSISFETEDGFGIFLLTLRTLRKDVLRTIVPGFHNTTILGLGTVSVWLKINVSFPLSSFLSRC